MSYVAIFIIFLILVITLVFTIRTKLIGLMSFGLKFGYFMFVIIILSGLFIPKAYELLADFSLEQVGVKDNIIQLDESLNVNSVIDIQDNIVDGFLDLISNQDSSDETADQTEQSVGYFEENIYPSFVDIFAFIYRVLAVVIGLLGLVAIVYLSYITSGATDTQDLKSKVAHLEQKVQMLESRLQ